MTVCVCVWACGNMYVEFEILNTNCWFNINWFERFEKERLYFFSGWTLASRELDKWVELDRDCLKGLESWTLNSLLNKTLNRDRLLLSFLKTLFKIEHLNGPNSLLNETSLDREWSEFEFVMLCGIWIVDLNNPQPFWIGNANLPVHLAMISKWLAQLHLPMNEWMKSSSTKSLKPYPLEPSVT